MKLAKGVILFYPSFFFGKLGLTQIFVCMAGNGKKDRGLINDGFKVFGVRVC